MTINLRTTPNFLNISGVTYSIQVFAENDIGEGPGSEPVSYTYSECVCVCVCVCVGRGGRGGGEKMEEEETSRRMYREMMRDGRT